MGGSLGFFSLPGDEYAIHELLDSYKINPDQPQNIKGLGFMVYDGGAGDKPFTYYPIHYSTHHINNRRPTNGEILSSIGYSN